MKFRATILTAGKTATGIPVPSEVVEGLGGGKRPAVVVTLNDTYVYRSTVAPMGGTFMLPVSAEHREKSGVAGGDEVDVELQLDTAPREVTIPPELAKLLRAEPEAKTFFDSLSFSNKQRLVLPIQEAKTPETRDRRLAKTMEALRAKRT